MKNTHWISCIFMLKKRWKKFHPNFIHPKFIPLWLEILVSWVKWIKNMPHGSHSAPIMINLKFCLLWCIFTQKCSLNWTIEATEVNSQRQNKKAVVGKSIDVLPWPANALNVFIHHHCLSQNGIANFFQIEKIVFSHFVLTQYTEPSCLECRLTVYTVY